MPADGQMLRPIHPRLGPRRALGRVVAEYRRERGNLEPARQQLGAGAAGEPAHVGGAV